MGRTPDTYARLLINNIATPKELLIQKIINRPAFSYIAPHNSFCCDAILMLTKKLLKKHLDVNGVGG
jgi:hypothetical protein